MMGRALMMILDYRANYVVAPAAVPIERRGYRASWRLSKPKRIADLYTAEIPKSFVYIIARGRMFPSKLYFEPRPVPVELPWMNAAVTSQPIWRPRAFLPSAELPIFSRSGTGSRDLSGSLPEPGPRRTGSNNDQECSHDTKTPPQPRRGVY